jgi:hypothetical protein
MSKPTLKELQDAQMVIFNWFIETNRSCKEDAKIITLLDTEIAYETTNFRLITHLSFYGRDELPPLKHEEIQEDSNGKI